MSELEWKARVDYAAAEAALRALEEKRDELIAPIKQALSDAEDRFENAQSCLPEFIGKCESCMVALFDGDQGHAFLDYESVLCENCAPTFGELVDEMDQIPEEEWDDHFGNIEEGIGRKNYDMMKSKPRDSRHIWKI